MKTLLPVLLLTLTVLCAAQDVEKPAAAPEVVTIATIVSYPRSVDTMARLWMTLYQACQAAGVPAGEVVAHTRSNVPGAVEQVLPQGQPQPTTVTRAGVKYPYCPPETIVLELQSAAFSPLVSELAKREGDPKLVLLGKDIFACWAWESAWPGTFADAAKGLFNTQGMGAGPYPNSLCLRLVVATRAETYTPELLDLVARYQVAAR